MSRQQSFGKQAAVRRQARPLQVSTPVARVEPREEASNPLALILGAIASLLVVGVLGIWMVMPFTYSARTVTYSPADYREITGVAAASRLLSKEVLARAEKLYGIDVSSIILPAKREKTAAMQQIAESCITLKINDTDSMIVMPQNGHAAFAGMVEYLTCAMQTNKQRLCATGERKRLVEQLMRLKDVRQNVLGFERAREAELATPMGQFGMKMTMEQRDIKFPVNFPFLGDQMDERIVMGIARLTREGYLSALDFGFMGLVLPAEYAPALSTDGPVAAPCG